MQSICLKDNIKFLIEFQTLVVEDFFLKQGVIIIKVYVFSFIDLIMIYNFNNPVIIIILYTCFLWLFCFFFKFIGTSRYQAKRWASLIFLGVSILLGRIV